MDPMSALGLAANIVAFVDFGLKVVKSATEVYRPAEGTTEDVQDTAIITNNLQSLMNRLRTPAIPVSTPEDFEKLVILAKNCSKICSELQDLIQSVSTSRAGSKAESLRIAWKTVLKKGKLQALETRLEKYRSQVLNHIVVLIRHVFNCQKI